MTAKLKLGTRGSKLAMWQSNLVKRLLEERGHEVELITIRTGGDANQTAPLANIGGQGVFTKALQDAMLDGRVDFAVHSLKDLPTDTIRGLGVVATPAREDSRDVLVAHRSTDFASLPAGAKIGTGSIRRRAQLLHLRSDLEMVGIRGNVDTRIRKVLDGEFDAIVLAAAGLKRLELSEHVSEIFEPEMIFPAVAQGAIGIEARLDGDRVVTALKELNHPPTYAGVIAERQMLRSLQGGCLAPIGAISRIENRQLTLEGVVLSTDGTARIASAITGSMSDPVELGTRLAAKLLDAGAGDLLR